MIAYTQQSQKQDSTTGAGAFITQDHAEDIQLVLSLGKLFEVYYAELEGALLAANKYYKIVSTKTNNPKLIYIF